MNKTKNTKIGTTFLVIWFGQLLSLLGTKMTRFALLLFGIRLLIQGYIFYKVMDKLQEKDLFPWWWLLDIWMFAYYLIFAPTIWKKPRTTWN